MRLGDAGELGLFVGMGVAFAVALAGPIGQAIAHRIRGGKSAPSTEGLSTGEMNAERVALLEDRIAQMETEKVQVEERLDFAERVLAKGSAEQRALGRGDAP